MSDHAKEEKWNREREREKGSEEVSGHRPFNSLSMFRTNFGIVSFPKTFSSYAGRKKREIEEVENNA